MTRKFQFLAPSSLCLLVLLAALLSQTRIAPGQDASTNNADPTTDFGASGLLDVDVASQITTIRLHLAPIPFGAQVSQATREASPIPSLAQAVVTARRNTR